LAIGDHVDHQIAAQAGDHMLAAGARVIFYRDFFYSGAPTAMQLKLSAARRGSLDLSAEEIERKIAALGCYATQVANLYGGAPAMAEAVRAREATEGFLIPQTPALNGVEAILQSLGMRFEETAALSAEAPCGSPIRGN
jgi:hypothetical protein